MLQRLIYSSEHQLPRPVVRDLVTSSSRNNRRLGVTGLLVGSPNCFVQVLEGERRAVSALFVTIASDVRHTNVRVIEACDILEAAYPAWGMTQLDDVARVTALWSALAPGRDLLTPDTMTAIQTKNLLRTVSFELMSLAPEMSH